MIFDFNLVAEYYDEYYNSEFGRKVDALEKRLIKKYIEQIPIKNALEVGCGTGHWTEFFINNGFEITGIDISENMINIARKKNLKDAKFEIINIEDAPYPDNSFDNIFAITSLEFVDNRQKAIEQIYRILKPGGYLLIGCLNQNSFIGKTKQSNKVFARANFFDTEQLQEILNIFGSPIIEGCALITDNKGSIEPSENKSDDEPNQVRDYDDEISSNVLRQNGAFLVGFVKKEQ